jgi:hypothetical protein
MTKSNLIRDRPSNSLSRSKLLLKPVILPDHEDPKLFQDLVNLKTLSTLAAQADSLKKFQGVATRWGASLSSNPLSITPKLLEDVSIAFKFLLAILDSEESEDLWRSVFSALGVISFCAGSAIQDLAYSLLHPWADKLVPNSSVLTNEAISIKSRNVVSFLLEEPTLARLVLANNTNESAYLLLRIVKALVCYVSAESLLQMTDKDASAVASLHRSDHIVVAVRELIQLLPLLVSQQRRMKEITTQVVEIWSLLKTECFVILCNSRTNREALTSVGLVLGILIANPILDFQDMDDIKMIIYRQIQELVVNKDSLQDKQLKHWFSKLPVAPRVAVVRGLLIAAPAEVLIMQTLDKKSLLEGPLFDCVDQACKHSDNHIRLFALQGLETFITSARKCCNSTSDDKASPSFILAAPILNGIATHVLSNWSHPLKRLSTMSTALFDQLIALVDAATVSTTNFDASKKEEISENKNTSSNVAISATSLLLSVLGQPVGQVARYGALLRILPRIGARSMMAQRPGLIEEAFSAVSFSTEVGNIAGSFVTAFLASLRQEIEQIAGLSIGSGGVSSAVWIRGDLLARHSDEQEKLIEETLSIAPESVRSIWRLATRFETLGMVEFEKQCLTARKLVQTGEEWQHSLRCQEGSADLIKRLELEIIHSLVYQFWSLHWRPIFLSQMLHPFRDQRIRCATHCASRLIGLDATRRRLLQDLLNAINDFWPPAVDRKEKDDQLFIGDDATSLLERKLWTRLQVGFFARAAGGSVLEDEPSIVSSSSLISYSEIARASSLPDSDTRNFALEVICMTLSPSLAPSPRELGAAIAWISNNLRAAGIATDSRKRVCRSIGFLLDRVNNALHQLDRALKAIEKKKKKKTSKKNEPQSTMDTVDSAIEMASQLVHCGSNFVTQLIKICSSSLYPNAPFDRVILPLELISLIADKLRSISVSGNTISFSLPGKDLLADIEESRMSTALLNLCHSSHERIRVIASTLLEKHVSPGLNFPCHIDVSSVASLFSWAILITQSPREREAAGGATLLNLLHSRYISSLGWSVIVDFPLAGMKECSVTITPSNDSSDSESKEIKSIDFLYSLTKLLDLRMAAFRLALHRLFGLEYKSSEKEANDIETRIKASVDGQVDLSNVSPLAHGLVSSIRMIMLGFATRNGERWKNAVSHIFSSIRAAQEMALRVVAGSEESDRDAGGPDAAVPPSSSVQSNEEFELIFKGRVDCPPTHLLSPSADLHAIGRDRPTAPLNSMVVTKESDNLNGTDNDLANTNEEDESAGQYDGQDAVGDSEIIGAAATDKVHADSNLEMAHMIVVASWLLVRECVDFQGGVVGAYPLQQNRTSDDKSEEQNGEKEEEEEEEEEWLIKCEDIEATGRLLLRSLLTLKHVGSIFACSEALQSICTKLHQTKGDVNQFPSMWLNTLLTRLTGASAAQFILRRSAGFSLAFVAILRSEPRNSAPVLLRLSMVVLLLLAGNSADDLQNDVIGIDIVTGDASSMNTSLAASFTSIKNAAAATTTWRTQVHALNILRLLFRDGSLGEDVGAFVPSALRTSLRGFKSKAWAVRNSSNMLFAAALERGLGIQSQKGDEGLSTARGGGAEMDASGAGPVSREARNRPSVSQFFSRYPSMRNILLDELTAVAESIESIKSTSETSIVPQTLTLFPTLLLIAKMRPTASLLSTQSGSGNGNDPLPSSESTEAFLPLIKSAARVDSAPIRRVAARALAAALPPRCAGDLALHYISELPLALDFRRNSSMSENYLHGLLLQIRTLVTSLHEEAGHHLQAHLSSKSTTTATTTTTNAVNEASNRTFSKLHSIHSNLCIKLEGWIPSSFSVPSGLTQSAALELVRGVAEAIITCASSLDDNAKILASFASKKALQLCRMGSGLGVDGAISHVNSTSFGANLMLTSCADGAATAATSRLLFLCNDASTYSPGEGKDYGVDACLSDLYHLLSHKNDDVRLSASRALKRSIKHAAASVNAILVNVFSSRTQGITSFESQRAEKVGSANTATSVLQQALSQFAGKSLFRLILDRLLSGENHPGVMRRLFRSAALLGSAASMSSSGLARLVQFKSYVADSISEQEKLWSDILTIYDKTRDVSAKSQALILIGLITSSFISSLFEDNDVSINGGGVVTISASRIALLQKSINLISAAAEDLSSFEARNSAAFCLSLGESIVLRAGLTGSIEPSISTVACKQLWLRALELLVDTDDEIREAARLSVATALSTLFGSTEGGLELLSHSSALLLSKVPEKLVKLLPPASAFLPENPNCESHFNIDLPMADEATTFVLGIAALICCFNNCCNEMREHEQIVSKEKASFVQLASTVLSVLTDGCIPVMNGTVELITAAKKDLEGQDGNNVYTSSAVENSSNIMPFNTLLLKRPMFQSDSMNEYAEPLIQGVLFAAAWSVCCEAVTDKDILSTRGSLFTSSAMEVMNLAAKVTTAASDVDIGLLLDPVLGHEGPWIAYDGIDDAPMIFAGCKTAEIVMNANCA